jgi:hypothetical protein
MDTADIVLALSTCIAIAAATGFFHRSRRSASEIKSLQQENVELRQAIDDLQSVAMSGEVSWRNQVL